MQRPGTFASQNGMEISAKFSPLLERGTTTTAHGAFATASVYHTNGIRSTDRIAKIKSLEGFERMGKKQNFRKQRESTS
ncbi:hypothetical protein BACPLE_03606 [Phocaeicola plebeius DSM 17135]|uniref:Uncharacterized protein n=1 Tax=Phocaeicola plebeius (strain DSM 17135 / JCM 12973 / CCUG 54634 / M2) TaxID=484018 RepID=B5D3L2_PHOPM|nr:hypothetical protein BACPLE_03606 [Phocaeicola plebeius DSM 17135]